MLFAFLISAVLAIHTFEDSDPEPIPISIDINSMEKAKEGCNTDFPCNTTLVVPYCGEKCWARTDSHYFQYTFKGVKFQIYGSIQTSNGNFSLYLDNKFVQEINLHGTTDTFRTLVYVSDVLPYGDHTIKAQGIGNLFEIYKFTFWPSLKAKRLNATDISSKGSWSLQANQAGGLHEVTTESNAKKTALIPTTKFWVYGPKNTGYGNLDVRIDDTVKTAVQNDKTFNNGLLFESDPLEFKEYVISLENPSSNGQKTVGFNCIFYEYDPPVQTPAPAPTRSPVPASSYEFIDKVFINQIPNGHIDIATSSPYKQISGCTFINVVENSGPFYIQPKYDFPFYDNKFEFSGPNYNTNSIIWCGPDVHSFTLLRCTFKNVRNRNNENEGTIFSSNVNINIIAESCNFINCGKTGDFMFKLNHIESTARYIDSIFSYDDSSNAGNICNFKFSSVCFDGCTFVRPATNMIKVAPEGNKYNNVFQFTNNVVEYCDRQIISTTLLAQKPRFSGNIFKNIQLNSGLLISFGHSTASIDLVNNTFENITSAKGSYGGGIASLYRHGTASTKVTLKYELCYFYDIKNANDASNYNQGGAVQYGHDSSLVNTELIFANCEFKRNQCMQGKGGSLGIKTNHDLTITGCTFEDNQASQEGGAIYVIGSSENNINIVDCIFIGNKGSDGSSIFIDGSSIPNVKLTVSDCIFTDNGELNNKFTIVTKCGQLVFENNKVEFSNKAKTSGAIQSANPSTVIITDSNFTNCIVNAYASILLESQGETATTTITNCRFIDCKASSFSIRITGGTSVVDSCIVSFESSSSSSSCGAIDFGNRGFTCQHSSFIRTNHEGAIIITQPSGVTSQVVVDGCTFDACVGTNKRCFSLSLRTTDFTFANNVLTNLVKSGNSGYFGVIDGANTMGTMTLQNITFKDNTCDSDYGGGTGLWLSKVNCIKFVQCKFINNVAEKASASRNLKPQGMTSYFNGDGGAIQYGFSSSIYNVDMVFDGCLFRQNKAVRHGGAIALQTIKTVEIINCIFEENEANYKQSSSSSELLYENHFSKKEDGKGGAIYINPTFTYIDKSNTINGKMTSVKIQDCVFKSNKAHDGFAIYFEGEGDESITFTISGNTFTDNYIDGSIQAGKSVIATEIYDLMTLNIETSNTFNYTKTGIKVAPLMHVDHYGVPFPTPSTTPIKTGVDVVANGTGSGNFYSISFDCLVDRESVKIYLSCSVCLVKTGIYFIVSFENQEISDVEYDTRDFFENNGKIFYLDYFVSRDKITYDKESKKLQFFSGSTSIKPESVENNLKCFVPETDVVLYDEDCTTNKNRCEVIVEEPRPVHVFVLVSEFSNFNKNNKDGGAIHLHDCCLTCKETDFKNCEIKEGGGGAIYINNNLDYTNNVTLEKLNFNQCRAQYGGAVYIHSNSHRVPVTVTKCVFTQNEATLSNVDDDSGLSGGSAIYLNIVSGRVSFCKFRDNIGSYSAAKIVNNFEDNALILSQKLSEKSDFDSISFVDCEFVVHKNGKSALMFVIGKTGSFVDVERCTFSGDLADEGHFIDEIIVDENANGLRIMSCKFSNDVKRSLNLDRKHDMKLIDLNNLVFNYNSKDKKEEFKESIIFSLFAVFTLLILATLMIILVIHLTNNRNEDTNENDQEKLSL